METIPKAPKSIANEQKKNIFQKILGSVLVLADYPNEKSCQFLLIFLEDSSFQKHALMCCKTLAMIIGSHPKNVQLTALTSQGWIESQYKCSNCLITSKYLYLKMYFS